MSDRGTSRAVVIAALICAVGCQSKPSAELNPSAQPSLRAVIVTDLTPARHRPVDLESLADETVRAALFAPDRFSSTRLNDLQGCAAEVGVYYGFVVNGALSKVADAGEARVILEGEVHCPVADKGLGEIETFRMHLKRQRPFGLEDKQGGKTSLEALIRTISETFAQAVIEQMKTRHASNEELLAVFDSSDNVGALMEAASEAGERRLVEALKPLIRLTAHADAVVSLRAGSALGMLGIEDVEALRALATMTEGPDPEHHLIAIHALGDIGGPRALRYLDTLAIGHPDPAMRDAARLTSLRAKDQLEADRPSSSGHDAPPKP